MNEESWKRLIEKAKQSAATSGERRFVIAESWQVGAYHGWTYHVVHPYEHVRLRPERYS